MINFNTLLTMKGVKKYAKDAAIVREGDSSTSDMYIILHGNAGVFHNYQSPGERMTATLNPGGFFGEMTLFAGKTREETVVALDDLIAIGIDRENAPQLFASQPELTFMIIESVCKRLDALTQEHESLLAETGRATRRDSSSGGSALFPEGHGTYTLAMTNKSDCLFVDTITCPLCGHTFKSLSLIATKLRRESTDRDMRVRYKDIEPLYYEIVTCPECMYSAQAESFAETSKKFWAPLVQAVSPYRQEKTKLKTGDTRDTFTVFAGYYLALLAAPVCYDEYQMVQAGLWQKLSRVYADCGDEAMVTHASRQALEAYLYAYQHFTLSERKDQQVCFILGDLYQRLGDLDQARNYFFQAKANQGGTPLTKRQADLRLDEIRDMKQQEKS